ncbi:DUF1636 family protein [Pontivivens ytuae]|uniref:DUF1636 domain-containing protein n=1 Tax=Pontivivens ytuae TaxID=2789856 RepID=A0A7S9LRB7_9RHOB|nr:DUF1636 domain-containing protein [Pontivivens ytuae]QPH53310.1 DUF1636 domain-containing protein [Pontivivens ytuae]
MRDLEPELPLLSICLTCRDGRENDRDSIRGGRRLADAVLARLADQTERPALRIRGVSCMSQCKRPCVVSLSASDQFTYVFGDLDPEAPDHVDALLALVPLYREAEEGFLRREERPEALRARILGRLPPPDTTSDLVTPLTGEAAA